MDAGDVWASVRLPDARRRRRASLYRNEVTEAAVRRCALTLRRLARGSSARRRSIARDRDVRGRARPRDATRRDRAIDWRRDDTRRAAQDPRGRRLPRRADDIRGVPCYLYDAHRGGRICAAAARAT